MDTHSDETKLENFDWSVRTLNVFKAYGIATIADLLAMSDSDLMTLENFSRKSLVEVDSFKIEWERKAPTENRQSTATLKSSILDIRLEDFDWSVRTLNVFQSYNIETIADLLAKSDEDLTVLPNFGRKSLREVNNFKAKLEHKTIEKNVVDDDNLDRYCSTCSNPLIPSELQTQTGREFLNALPVVLEEIAAHLSDPVYAAIFQERLSKASNKKKTLEEIGSSLPKKITRERVRQKENKLLYQLVRALVWDKSADLGLHFKPSLGIHFRPSFTRWWRVAAEFLSGREDIDFDEFLSGLCNVWQVDAGQLTEHLPIILSIVTGDGGMPEGFRSAARLDHRLYGDLHDETRQLPLSKLRVGKYASQLEAWGTVHTR